MKQYIIVDDIDGPIHQAETIPFGLDGVTYEIDLNKEHQAELRDVLSRFIKAGRPRQGRIRSRKSPAKAKATDLNKPATRIDQMQAAAVRRWARENGHQCSNKGRIPGHILQEYHKLAHPSTQNGATEESTHLHNNEAAAS